MYVFLRFWMRGKPLKLVDSFIMSASNEKVYYAVGRGKEIGIYDSWKECKAQTEGVANAKYRKFYSLEEAKEFVSFWKNYSGKDSVESKNSVSNVADQRGSCANTKECTRTTDRRLFCELSNFPHCLQESNHLIGNKITHLTNSSNTAFSVRHCTSLLSTTTSFGSVTNEQKNVKGSLEIINRTKQTNGVKELGGGQVESDDNMDNHCETKNCEVKVEPASEPESALSQLRPSSHVHLQPSSPHTLSYEGRVLSHKEVDVLAVNLRLDSLEKRFDSCLKEFGAMTAEISRLVTAVNDLKESLKSGAQSGSGTSPRKGKDGLYQTTLSFGTGSDSPSRYFSTQKRAVDSDEPDSKRGRSLKRRLSRRGSEDGAKDGEDIIEKLSKRLKAGEVDMSSFNVDDDGFVEVYTDGSALSNGKADAKAGIGIWFGDDHPLNVAEPVVGNATSVTAEIQAARVAIELANRAGVTRLKILTDSEFLINCITKWIHRWKKNGWTLSKGGPVKNRGELEKLDSAASKITVRWEKVPAHSKIRGNETADRLANQGAARYDR